MKKVIVALMLVLLFATEGFCYVKYIRGFYREDGTYVNGHYRDTSNDGIKWNNANELGYNE